MTSRGTLDEFQRRKVYDDSDSTDDAVGVESARLEEVGASA